MSYYGFYNKRPAPKAAEGAIRKNYGNTWWGKQWLQALTEIDDSNRLPRGKTYANKGLVSKLEIERNTIAAAVQGSDPRPYRIKISIPKFNDDEQKRLLQLITENPLFLSKLLNRELPPELDEACRREKIHIFPRSWRDISGNCSCPDWAVPCKHMAAVFYIVANEIDKNPFTVFDLHDFNLVAALEKSGFSEGATDDVKILKNTDLQQPITPETPDFEFDEAAAADLDFSKIPANCSENLLRLLSERPVFFPEGDFKKLLAAAQKSVGTALSKLETVADFSENNRRLLRAADSFLVIQNSETANFWGALLLDEQANQLLDCPTEADFVHFLEKIPPAELALATPNLRSLHLIFQFSRQLAQRGAFVPQILQVEKGTFRIRFVPALLNDEVRSIFEKVKKTRCARHFDLHRRRGRDPRTHRIGRTDGFGFRFFKIFRQRKFQKTASRGANPEVVFFGRTDDF